MKIAHTLLRMVISLGLALGLAACGGEEPTPVASVEPVELQLITFDALGAVEQALIEQFEADHPTIKIDLDQYSQSPGNYLTDPTPPDILTLVPGADLNNAIDQGLLTDISDLWQQANLDDTYPAALRALSDRDGKQFLLPIGYTWNAIYYNKQIFAQYNLQPPRTWDEFIALCDTLLLNGEIPLSLSGDDSFLAALWFDYLDLRLNGSDFHRQLTQGDISYAEDQVRAVYETWYSFVERGYFTEDSYNLSTLASLTAIVRNEKLELSGGKAVMTLAGPVFLADLPQPFHDQLDFFPFPLIDPTLPQTEVVFAIGYVAPANAAHRSEALTFLNYVTSEAARELLVKDVNTSNLYVPAFATAAAENLPPIVRQGMALVQDADTVISPYMLEVSEPLQFSMNNTLRRLLFNTRNGKPFDLEGLLVELEEARQQ